MHVLNFQLDFFVGWIVHIELKVPLLSRIYIHQILIFYLEDVLLAQYVQPNQQRDLVESLECAPVL